MIKWRVSLRKSLPTRRKDKSVDEEDTLSNEVVQYRGVSLASLNDLWSRTVDKKVVGATELFVTQENVEDVFAGTTVRQEQQHDQDGFFTASVPYRKELLRVHESQVQRKTRLEWTIEDMCEHVVLPLTVEKTCFFLDLCEPKDVGKPFRGAFVSQARKSSFVGLLTALNHHYKERNPKQVFLWLDLFSANQPLLTGRDQASFSVQQARYDILTRGLHEAIDNFEERVIFFNAWDNPYPLQRAWCVWELYGSAVTGKELELIFDPNTEKDVLGKLLLDSDSLLQAISDLDLRKMQCHSAQDLAMIRHAVEGLEGGFSGLKARITERLRKWLLVSVEHAVRQNETWGGEGSAGYGDLLNQAGLFMSQMGEYDVAMSYLRHAIECYRTSFGTEEENCIAGVFSNMGVVHEKQGAYEEAIQKHRAAIRIYEVGEASEALATTYCNLGNCFESTGEYEAAYECYEKVLRIFKDLKVKDHPLIVDAWNNMAIVCKELGELERAMEFHEKVLELRKQTLGERHPSTASTYNNMAVVFKALGQFEQALEMYAHAMEILKETLGESHIETAAVYNNMANVYQQLGDLDKALEMHNIALELKRKLFGNEHPSLATSYLNLGSVLESQGNLDAAVEAYTHSLKIAQASLGEDHPDVADAYSCLGTVYDLQGSLELSLQMFDKALEILRNCFGANHPSVAETEFNLGVTLQCNGRTADALEHLENARRIFSSTLGEHHQNTRQAVDQLASCS